MLPRCLLTQTIAVALLTTGCTDRFSADFEADQTGELPASTPPGMPDDFIAIFPGEPRTGDPAAVLSVEAAPTGSEESRALTFRLGGDTFTRVDFLSDRMGRDDSLLFVQWDQVMSAPGRADVFLTGDTTTSANCWVSTWLTGLGFRCTDDTGSSSEDLAINDFTPFELHTVRLTINRAAKVVALTVIQDGVGSAQSKTGVPGGPVVPENTRLTARISFHGTALGSYAIDRFTVSELN
jgi:hypothetical protein